MMQNNKPLLTMDLTRRDFLRGSTAVTAALSLGGADMLSNPCFCEPMQLLKDAKEAAEDPLLLELKEVAINFTSSPANDMGLPEPEPIWDEPLFGVASGADPLWDVFKETAVGSEHWSPREAFLLAFPEETDVTPEELSVLVWILPQTRRTNEDNRRQNFYPSERWIRSRWFGESDVNGPLRRLMVEEINSRGIQAMSPGLLHEFVSGIGSPADPAPISPWSPFGRASTFSERHAAFAAGLGTFGLSDGLITKIGKAHRIGSVVLRATMEPTPRPYTEPYEYCLFFKDASCAMCVSRCPVDSVRILGRDKEACLSHLRETTMSHVEEHMGWENFYGCGLCQTLVPCEFRIP